MTWDMAAVPRCGIEMVQISKQNSLRIQVVLSGRITSTAALIIEVRTRPPQERHDLDRNPGQRRA
jgi:hypothetical protein